MVSLAWHRRCSPLHSVSLALFCVGRGQVRLVHGSGATGLQLVQSYSDSDEDSDGAWEGRLGDRYNPPGKPKFGSVCLGLFDLDVLAGILTFWFNEDSHYYF